MTTVLITGAAGFVGSAVHRQLVNEPVELRLLVHRRTPDRDDGARLIPGDLTRPDTLHGVCDSVDTVVHLACSVDEDDPRACELVNDRGTSALVAEARRAGVRRIVHLSTAAVYGPGPHRGATTQHLVPAPVSVVSRTRLAAERTVRAARGIVLRPMLVYGPGDRWLIPKLARTLTALPISIEEGRARLSLVAVEDLAAAFAVLARADWDSVPGGEIYHVNHPEPVAVRDLAAALTEHLGVPAPEADIGYVQAREILANRPRDLRRLALFAQDHYYDSSPIWRRTGHTPGGFAVRFPAAAPWYRAHLAPLAPSVAPAPAASPSESETP
ncbi:NAD(P)-dependent oxidoreductase [Streptomyces sp.]|uniref:NAD-dependent epimerase/dehydratase family protein n=1 Tax=Streptomyces sp. TaxID=1931 RepID=UPI002D7707BF|nr:NAD(P)-dependent oxidoreductase [Streptomyces sp.]HET6357768.1 NAD(P)-dependent oxidoreductase [Streptomyces sp.]